jgi:hypothetical protein
VSSGVGFSLPFLKIFLYIPKTGGCKGLCPYTPQFSEPIMRWGNLHLRHVSQADGAGAGVSADHRTEIAQEGFHRT